MFRAIRSDRFPPFGELQINFPPVDGKPADLGEVHLLTGVNGTGKTRILALLAAMMGQPDALFQRIKGIEGCLMFQATDTIGLDPDIAANTLEVYPTQREWRSSSSLAQWASRVPAFAYSGAAWVKDAEIAVMADLPRPDRQSCLAFTRPEADSKTLLQAIANLKIQAAMDFMNKGRDSGPTHPAFLVNAVESTVAGITGRPFSFQLRSYPKPTLEVDWGNALLRFDLLPDGLRSIVGWLVHAVFMMDTWLQGKTSPHDTEAVFLLDEPEGHLHPAWQRRILPAFQRLFPKAQIFVATHSPFVIASLNHGWIHQFSIDSSGRVTNREPRKASEGDSYVSVVEDIMGVNEWYDPETEKLLADFRAKRDAAYKGDSNAKAAARDLAGLIGKRSLELDYMMGRELSQMDRQLAKAAVAQ